jgi:DNA polymerase-3 subunit delta'
MKFADIRGQQDLRDHLQRAIAHEKFSHAYIISGEKDSGKMMLAEAFAATILCKERKGEDACGECRSCRQAAGHNHPDIRYLIHEKPNTISVDDIRLQINEDIMIKPYASDYKIYIVDEAEKMNIQAQNALLKTIEEPPSYGILFLLTTNAAGFLPTILSRCITLEMQPVDSGIIKKYLMEKEMIPDYQAQIYAAFAQGNMGKAIKLASSEEFNEMKTEMVSLLRQIGQMDVYGISQVVSRMEENKEEIQDYFDLMNIWFRDVLLYKATGQESSLTFRDESMIIKKQAKAADYHGIELILEALDKAGKRRKANVNLGLTLELLLLAIKENIA